MDIDAVDLVWPGEGPWLIHNQFYTLYLCHNNLCKPMKSVGYFFIQYDGTVDSWLFRADTAKESHG